MTVYRVAVWVHLLAAALWVGGSVLFAWAAPALRRAGPAGSQAFRILGLRFRSLSWLAVAALTATGALFLSWGWDLTKPPLRDKLGLVILAVALKAAHDFWAAPRAARGELSPGWAVLLARANLLALLGILYFATLLGEAR